MVLRQQVTENGQKFVVQAVRHHTTANSLRWKDWEDWITTSERKDSEISRKRNYFQEQKPEEDGLICTPNQIWLKWNKGLKAHRPENLVEPHAMPGNNKAKSSNRLLNLKILVFIICEMWQQQGTFWGCVGKHPRVHWTFMREGDSKHKVSPKAMEHFSTSWMLKSSEQSHKRGGKKPKIGWGFYKTPIFLWFDILERNKPFFFFFLLLK